jgi:glycosyltransferase involved in cell wall biosynthesis
LTKLIKISVIITTYNSEEFIFRTIDSIKNQVGKGELFELEIIVVDDCSKDGTRDLIDSEVVLLSTKTNSGGPNKGRNIGLSQATGDYISISDHDDLWYTNRILILLEYLKNYPIVTCGYTEINQFKNKEIKVVGDQSKKYIEFDTNETFLNKLTRQKGGQNSYLGSIIYSSKFKNILFEEQYGVVDYDWILRLMFNRNSVEVCEVLYNRFVDKNNLSLNESYRLKDFNYSREFISRYEKKYPIECSLSKKRMFGSMGRYYYLIGEMEKARENFLKSNISLKTYLYYITSYIGHKLVKKWFNVFG